MSGQFDILVVCLGNVCRSPIAEHLLRARLDTLLGERAGEIRVSSAGARALVDQPMEESAARELLALGGDPRGFTASQVTSARLNRADLVLTATRGLRSRVLEDAPRALRRTFTIREFAALADARLLGAAGLPELVAEAASWRGTARLSDYDVPDPIGRSAAAHRAVAEMLDGDVTRIAQTLAQTLVGRSLDRAG